MNPLPFCLTLLFTTAIFVNELFGPALLAVALLVTMILIAAKPRIFLVNAVQAGAWLWLVLLLILTSTFWSGDPSITLRAATQVGLTIILAICLCSYTRPIHLIQSIAVVCGVIVVASLISGRQGLDAMTGSSNLVGITANKNTLSIYAGLLVLTSVTLFATARIHPAWKLLAIFGAPIGFITSLLSYSVAAVSITIVATSVMIAINFAQIIQVAQRRQYTEQLLALGCLVAPIAGMASLFFWDDALRLVGKEPTLTGRTILWFYADRFSRDHPLLGTGYADFWVQGKAPAELMWHMLHVKGRFGFHFHNIYYQFFIETGIVGVLFLIFYQISIICSVLRRALIKAESLSAFYIAITIFVTIEEFQGVALFQPFNPLFFTLVSCTIFARMTSYRVPVNAPRRLVPTGDPPHALPIGSPL